MDFNQRSYVLHEKHYNESFNEKSLNSWKTKDTVDYWRHERMYKMLDPLIENHPGSSWLTVGDGRYGTDANYILSKGIKEVLATDISDTYLKIAKDDGYIKNYKVENAENLSFDDKSYDFVLCKESYHHFPRPMVALYEMIRVAKEAVILIEPQDSNILIPSKFGFDSIIKWGIQVFKNRLKEIFGKKPYYFFGNYESVGNYVYTISEREIEKVGLGLNLNYLAFKAMNDHYIPGVEFEKNNQNSKIFKEIKSEIKKKDDSLAKGLLCAIIFKDSIRETCLRQLVNNGFSISELSKNPYIQ